MKTILWIILFVVSVGVGTFVDVNILEKMAVNVWVARGVGCLISVIVALVLHHFFIKTEKSEK